MDCEFTVPLDDDELLRCKYATEQIDDPDLILSTFRDISIAWDEGDVKPAEILEKFDAFLGVIRNFSTLRPNIRGVTWDLLLQGFSTHVSNLSEYLNGVVERNYEHESEECRVEQLNTLLVIGYLLCRMLQLVNATAASNTSSLPTIAKTKRRGAKKCDVGNEDVGMGAGFDWPTNRDAFLDTLSTLLTFKVYQPDTNHEEYHTAIRLLWKQHTVHESFSNMCAKSVVKLLEDAEVAKSGWTCMDSIFKTLLPLIRHYGRAKFVAGELVTVLQRCEHLGATNAGVNPLADHVSHLVSNHVGGRISDFLPELCLEIGNIEAEDISREGSAKACASFIITLAENCPTPMYSNLSSIAVHLETDSWVMRCAVLTVFVEIALSVLGGENRTKDERSKRDKLLEKEHLMDTNAYVRAKAIQLWAKLAQRRQIPLTFLQDGLLDEISGRLHDRSSTVRKNAIAFLAAFLKSNPYKDQLDSRQLQPKLEEAEQILADVRKTNPATNDARVAFGKWEEVEDIVKKSLQIAIEREYEKAMGNDNEETVSDSYENDDHSPEDFESAVFDKIDAGEIEEGCVYFVRFYVKHTVVQAVGQTEDTETKVDEVKLAWFNEQKRNSTHDTFIKKIKDSYLERKVTKLSDRNMDDDIEETDEQHEYERNQNRAIRDVEYLKDTIRFSEKLKSILEQICALFRSNSPTDVLETIEFVTTCYEFRVPGHEAAVRKLCNLIWRKRDQTIREAVIKAYKRMYLTNDAIHCGGSRSQLLTAENLMQLVATSNESDLASQEELISEMIRQNLISAETLGFLWQFFSGKMPNQTEEQSLYAIRLLAMAANAELKILSTNFDRLLRDGLGERADRDFAFAKAVFYALSKLAQKVDLKNEDSIRKEPYRFTADAPLFTRLVEVLENGIRRFEDANWTGMMEQAVNVLFYLSEHATQTAAKLIRNCVRHTLTAINDQQQQADKDDGESNEQQDNSTDATNNDVVSQQTAIEQDTADVGVSVNENRVSATVIRDRYLCRLMALIGHIALRVLIHLDVAYCGEMKRRHYLQNLTTNSPKGKRKSGKKSGSGLDTTEDDMGIVGAAADDDEQDEAVGICESEVLAESSVLGRAEPIVLLILNNYQKFSAGVQSATSIALSKIMLISRECCKRHLHLFFSLLRRSPIASVRANLMVATGDLCFRFPNEMEPWSNHLYEKLHDDDQCVRQNCLLVLTHLILNDMIKVKGHVADIAICTLDGRNEMAGLAKRFFHELANKGNTVYNLMPDIIRRLSNSETRVPKDQFHEIMKFMFQFIHKDKQCEGLVEKLCQRFQDDSVDSDNDEDVVTQWRYLSFCLAQLPYNDKALRKLQDNVACYSAKLKDKEVYEHFCAVLQSAKKSAKTPEIRSEIDEMESQWTDLHQVGAENADAVDRANRLMPRRQQGGGRSPRRAPRTPRRQKHQKGSSDEE